MFHQLTVRHPEAIPSPALVEVEVGLGFQLEFLRAETFQDWLRLCEKQENEVDQKEVMRFQNDFQVGIVAFATLVVEQEKSEHNNSNKKNCIIPAHNEWFWLDPVLETCCILKPTENILSFFRRETRFPAPLVFLILKYLELPCGKRLLFTSQVGRELDSLKTSMQWSPLFEFGFYSSSPGTYLNQWILQKIQEQIRVVFLNKNTGDLVPQKIQSIRTENHFYLANAHSCTLCDNCWAREWSALKIEGLDEWIEPSFFATQPWVNSTHQYMVKWNKGIQARFYHFCKNWIQPYSVKSG